MGRKEALFGILHGNFRNVITKISVDLPKKGSRGGSSAIRFARIRLEKRQNYVRKVSQMAEECFITDGKVNVTGIILAIEGIIMSEFQHSDVFTPVSCFSLIMILRKSDVL